MNRSSESDKIGGFKVADVSSKAIRRFYIYQEEPLWLDVWR